MRLLEPATLEELLALKAQHGTDAMLIAGGTDVGVRLRRDPDRPAVLLSTGGIDSHDFAERARVTQPHNPERPGTDRSGAITFGVRTTHRSIERLGDTDARLRGLADACRTIGSVQTRNVGTLVGNIANASPAADAVTALLSLGASVKLQSVTGSRVLALDDFATGPGQTALMPQEVITHVEVPATQGPCGTAFSKLGRRRAMEISIVAAAAIVRLHDDGNVASAGLALGAVGPTVTAVPGLTGMLRGLTFGGTDATRALEESGEAATRAAQPRSDHRASASYRKQMTRLLATRVLTEAWNRALHESDSHG